MNTWKVWGEWQEYNEAPVSDKDTAEGAARSFASSAEDAFPDWNDGDKTIVYARPVDAEDGDDEWCPEEDSDTLTFTARLRITSDITVTPKR
jgi:hypothetical protein